MNAGNVFDIQRFSVHDGPGIRTTVFLKGCPLRCLWCHNPESHTSSVSLAYYAEKCVACGSCVDACAEACHNIVDGIHTLQRDSCTACGECSRVCAFGAVELMGNRMTVDSVLAEVLRDKAFYTNSGGGMTVSGGEPLAQPEFLIELLMRAREQGIHTCIETSGYAAEEVIRRVAEYTDLFLYDVKATDCDKHRLLTGVDFSPILDNLRLLDSLGKQIVLRCPLIPEVNTDDAHISNIALLASGLVNLVEINVMAYHTLGNAKYEALAIDNRLAGRAAMSDEEKQKYINRISDLMVNVYARHIRVC